MIAKAGFLGKTYSPVNFVQQVRLKCALTSVVFISNISCNLEKGVAKLLILCIFGFLNLTINCVVYKATYGTIIGMELQVLALWVKAV